MPYDTNWNSKIVLKLKMNLSLFFLIFIMSSFLTFHNDLLSGIALYIHYIAASTPFISMALTGRQTDSIQIISDRANFYCIYSTPLKSCLSFLLNKNNTGNYFRIDSVSFSLALGPPSKSWSSTIYSGSPSRLIFLFSIFGRPASSYTYR